MDSILWTFEDHKHQVVLVLREFSLSQSNCGSGSSKSPLVACLSCYLFDVNSKADS